jgi:NAD(P)-dependent dehydrogenase (short-subunit alcohol dehydrogenase family)
MMSMASLQAAMNMITKSLHEELKGKGILVTALHPGWARTNIGGPHADLSAEESVHACMNVLSKLSSDNPGIFMSYSGEVLDW